MIRGITTVNRNMNILQKKLENISSNISNVNTPGYKFQSIVQSSLENHNLINYQGSRNINRRTNVGGYIFGNQIDGLYRDFSQGNLINTDNISDFSINGDGFFAIRLDSGQLAYTRNGNFKISEDKRLVTMQGYSVLAIDEEGNIKDILIENNNIDVDTNGIIDNSNLRILIVDFDNYNNLESMGETIFLTNQNYNILTEPNLRQGYLEMSNINQVDEIVKLIEISKEFQANQRVLHAEDETLSKAVNELGRV